MPSLHSSGKADLEAYTAESRAHALALVIGNNLLQLNCDSGNMFKLPRL